MATKKATEGVGKKIVEALKKQSAPIVDQVVEDLQASDLEEEIIEEHDASQTMEEEIETEIEPQNTEEVNNYKEEQPISMPEQSLDTGFLNNVSFSEIEAYTPPKPQPVYTMEPEVKTDNVKILSNLIHQLPPGISKQTGAQIIKQTMEALGISMKTVLAEAQQIQERISTSSNECLNSIQDCKKQIQLMEKQVQQYHKQYNALNELISLFVQTGI